MDIAYLKSHIPDLGALSVTPISGVTRMQIWRHTLPHALPSPGLVWFTRGHARMIVDGRAIGISPNVCVVLPANTGFAIEPGAQMQASLVQLPISPLLPMPEGLHLLRIHDIATQGEVSGLIERIASGLEHGGPGADRAALARAMLLTAVLERLTRTATPLAPATAPQRLAARFTQEVEQCYATGATLADIGDMLDVTPTHLTRTLKATCGMTAAHYLGARLMHAARSELLDTPHSAADIARDLGFSSAAYFSRAFLHHAGETPGKFRARHRAKAPRADARSSTSRAIQSA